MNTHTISRRRGLRFAGSRLAGWRTIARTVAVMAGGFGLASCASSLPSFDFFSSKPSTATLTIESDPPGADARVSIGGNCRTPCTQAVAVANEFSVSYSLNGYTPQTVTVRPAGDAAQLDPNPVFAQLQPVAPPPKAPPPKKKKRPRPPVAAAAPADQGLAQPPQGGFAPPTGTFTPQR